jgi:hypothetical protein
MLYIQSGWAQPAFTGYVTNCTCYGMGDGKIDIQITGGVMPYDVKIDSDPWVNNISGSSYSFANLSAGSHTVEVRDDDYPNTQFVVSQTFTVMEPDELVVTGIVHQSSCPPLPAEGYIELEVHGGVPNYQYLWSNGVTTKNIVGLPCDPATYTVTVTDQNSCSTYGSWLYEGVFLTEEICQAGTSNDEGKILLEICCGTGPSPYSYVWTTTSGTPGFPRTTEDIINLGAGDYSVVITDPNTIPNIIRYYDFSVTAKKSTCSANYLQNQIVLSGENNCYDAGGILFVAGDGTNFTVQAGGTATLIAGEKISFLPGTRVYQGGTLHGYITTTGQFCGDKSGGGNGNGEGIDTDTMPNPTIAGNTVFRAWPNPTTGNFILELNGDNGGSNIQADIYSIQGEKIVAAELKGEKRHEFSLAGFPPGLYFIRVVAGMGTAMGKIVKQ